MATVTPPIPDVEVYFKVWDVDDPFDQIHGPQGANDIANVALIDNDLAGSDNRPVGETPWESPPVITDANGRATVTITVSMQPGNNYRAGASVDPPEINGTTQPQADGNAPPVNVEFSPMLTVWRKLHVETDSMARPTFAENTINVSWNEPRFPTGELLLDINDQQNNDHFENGFIRIQSDGFADVVTRIITSENSFEEDEIYTSVSVADWGNRPTSGLGIISDDDLANEARFTAGILGSDMGVGDPPNGFLPLPDTSGLTAHYQPAYILPVIDTQHTSVGSIAFMKNLSDFDEPATWDPALSSRTSVVSSTGYWTSYIYSAFQAEQSEDFDGEITATKGISTHADRLIFGVESLSSVGPQYTGMCAAFAESLRDGFGEQAHKITVAHEIAHTLGVDHTAGLMHKTLQTNDFAAGSILELRTYTGP